MTSGAELAQPFLDYSVAKLRQYLDRIEVCLGKLEEPQIWVRGQENENSIGNLCLHLNGNVRQWILSGVGGEPDERRRDAEFAASGGVSRFELVQRLRATVPKACECIGALTPARLQDHVSVQDYRLTVLEAVYHGVEHFSYHAGQILFVTKALSGEDLGFHRHLGKTRQDQKTP